MEPAERIPGGDHPGQVEGSSPEPVTRGWYHRASMNPGPPVPTTAPKLEAKHLYRRLDALFRSIEKARTPRRLVEAFLDGVFRELAEPLKFRSASLYMERPSGFRLSKQLGEPAKGAFDTLSPDA